jgi:hypothetical protein
MRPRIIAVLAAVLGLLVLTPQVAAAEAPQTYQIAGTDIGLMFRSDPNDWESRIGPAGYDGDNVTLECETQGTPAGPRANNMWYQASTALGSGYLPDAFLNTPTHANEWLPGLPRCDADATAPSGPKSVFFSGTDVAKGSAAEDVSDKDYALNDWATGGTCKGDRIPSLVPDTVDTLAGWSRGRIGVVYFLANASQEQRDRIHRIILFDPASLTDIEGSFGIFHYGSACDFEFDVNDLIAKWLESDSRNQLIVYTGARSEVKKDSDDPKSESTFAGLWKYYFAGIWEKPSSDRALVCDYNVLSHEDSLSQFASTVKHPRNDCPAAPAGHPLQAWHP